MDPVRYRKPRRINIVSVTLMLMLGVLAFLAYRYVPLILLEQETYRVLEETGSAFAGHGIYQSDLRKREQLRRKMEADLRLLGIRDPELETWIEMDEDGETRVGAVYSVWVHWPFDVLPRHKAEYEVEHVFQM